MKKLLIVVDMQNDFVTGVLGTPEAQTIVPNVRIKINEYLNAGFDIIFTRDTHSERYLQTQEGKNLPVPHCIYDTEGWQVVSELQIPNPEYINKESFGYDSWCLEKLHVYDEIEMVGVCTDICVISNALIIKAEYPEMPITVDASCCAGLTPEKHLAALSVMESCQINVINK